MTRGRAYGKVILLGEHFVVHGAPAIAVPLSSRTLHVRVTREAGPWGVPEPCRCLLEEMLIQLGESPDAITLHLSGDLPMGQGLGGSAALAVALLRALGVHEPASLQRKAHELERLTHGTPSGIDDCVVAWERPILFTKGEGAQRIAPCPDLKIWVGLTGASGSTQAALARVRVWRDHHPLEFADLQVRVGGLVRESVGDLAESRFDLLGAKLTENHGFLQEIGVSTPRLDTLVDAAVAAGAWGAKLTGSGLGGAVIAIAPQECDLESAWRRAGVSEVIAP